MRNRGGENSKKRYHMFQELTRESGEHSQNSWWQSAERGTNCLQSTNDDVKKCKFEEHSQDSSKQQWCELSEVVESDFLISPGDVYPNRKVELEDADIKDATRVSSGTVPIHLTVKTLQLGTPGN